MSVKHIDIVETLDLPVSSKGKKSGTTGSRQEAGNGVPPSSNETFEREPLVPKLDALESQIARNKGRPLLMGRDLKTIRDQPLYYRSTGHKWDDYCKGRFKFGKRAADYYIAAWLTARNCGVPDDFSPRSLRPLTRLTPEHQKQAWANAVAMTKQGRPSPRDIRIAASKFTTKPIIGWTLRAAHAVHELHFKIGLKKALAGATEKQAQEYCEKLNEYALDWVERHNTIPAKFDVETALETAIGVLKRNSSRQGCSALNK